MKLSVLFLSFILVGIALHGQSAFSAPVPKKKTANKEIVKTDPNDPNRKVVYTEGQTVDFEGLSLEGELKAPGEFYFQNRNQERFDSLTKRRLNFHREMLRDSIQSQ